MKKILFFFGTRPEAIKLAPLIQKLKEYATYNVKVCVTGQHKEMLQQVLLFFNITPDYDLCLMKENQQQCDIVSDMIKGINCICLKECPELIIVQGDTATVLATCIAASFNKIKIAHLEAGLRSHNKLSPFPEEINRVLAGHMADIHFAPTETAARNLKKEGILSNVHIVGNTVIDSLHLGLSIIKRNGDQKYIDYFDNLDLSKKIILITTHRRENFGVPLEEICDSIKILANKYENINFVIPVHLNPNVKNVITKKLSGVSNIHLYAPLSYEYLIWIMSKSYLVLTDSGGIQEEAPALGLPVLVLRETTERVEGIDSGTAKLVGHQSSEIVNKTKNLLENDKLYEKMSKAINPYGCGDSVEQIIKILENYIFLI